MIWVCTVCSEICIHVHERDGLCLSQLCPRYSGTLTHWAIRLWQTYTFYHISSVIRWSFVSFQINPKNLDLSYKTDLDFGIV